MVIIAAPVNSQFSFLHSVALKTRASTGAQFSFLFSLPWTVVTFNTGCLFAAVLTSWSLFLLCNSVAFITRLPAPHHLFFGRLFLRFLAQFTCSLLNLIALNLNVKSPCWLELVRFGLVWSELDSFINQNIVDNWLKFILYSLLNYLLTAKVTRMLVSIDKRL